MYVKFGKKKILTLLLVLIAAFCMTGTALAATLKIGAISGDLKGTPSYKSDTDTWKADVYYYPATAVMPSLTIESVSGIDYTTNEVDLNLTPTTSLWTIDGGTTATFAISGGQIKGKSFSLAGPVPASKSQTLYLQGTDSTVVNLSNQITLSLTFVEGELKPVFDKTSLNFPLGTPSSQVLTVTALNAGSTSITKDNFTLSSLQVLYNSSPVTSWNSLTVTTDATNKTITFAGSPSQASSRTFTVRMVSPEGDVADGTITVTATQGGSGAAIAMSSPVVRFYTTDASRTVTLNVETTPSDLQIQTLITNPPSEWNGLALTTNPSAKTVTISGTPLVASVTSVDVTATTADGSTLKTSFSVAAYDQRSLYKIDASPIGIWDYANYNNKSMVAAKLYYYNNVSTNTGYTAYGRFDLIFYTNEILDGDTMSVYVKEPDQTEFVKIQRFTADTIPVESWYYVDKSVPPSPYTVAPRGRTVSCPGWYRDDIDTAANTMSIVVNSQPYMAGDHTFRFEYVTNEDGGERTQTQEFVLRCSAPPGGSNGSGGGCDAGLGLAVFGLLAAGGFAAARKRRG